MLTKSDFPNTANRVDLEVKFNAAMEAAVNTDHLQLLEIVPTTSSAKEEIFYGDKARLRRMRGERQPQKFNEYKMILTLDEWELTHAPDKKLLDDDQSPQKTLTTEVQNFGNAVASSKEAEFWEFLRNGASISGFDRARFFDFNHRYVTSSGVTISAVAAQSNMNLGGSGLDATTVQLDRQNYAGIRTDQNKPWGGRMTHVAVFDGSQNHKNAMELANSQFTVEASTVKGQMTQNVFKGAFNIITTVYGLGTTEWMSFDLSDPRYKPVKVLSHSVSPGFDNMEFSMLGLESDNGFWRREVAFGVYGRWDYNPGYWQTAYLHGSSNYSFTPADTESQRVMYPNQF